MTAAIIPPPSCYHLVNELTERLSNSCGPHVSHADILHVGYSFFCEKLDQQRYVPRSYPPPAPAPAPYPYNYSPYSGYPAPPPQSSKQPPPMHIVPPYSHVNKWQYATHPYDSPPSNPPRRPTPMPLAMPEMHQRHGPSHYFTRGHPYPHVSTSTLPPSPYYSPHEVYRQEPEKPKLLHQPTTPPKTQHSESDRKLNSKNKSSECTLDTVLGTIREHPSYVAARSSRKVTDLAYCLWATKLGIAEGSLASQGLYLEASFMTDSVAVLDGNRCPQAVVDMNMQFLRPPKPQLDMSVKIDSSNKEDGLSFLNPDEEREEMLHMLCSTIRGVEVESEGPASTNAPFIGTLPLPEGDLDLDHFPKLREAVYSRLTHDDTHAADDHGMRLRRRSNRIISESIVSSSIKRGSIEPENRVTKRIKLTMSSEASAATIIKERSARTKSSLSSTVTKITAPVTKVTTPVKIKLRLATGLKNRGRGTRLSSIKSKDVSVKHSIPLRRRFSQVSSRVSQVSPESSPEVSPSPEWDASDSGGPTSDISDDSEYDEVLSDSQETTPRRRRTGKPSSLLPDYVRWNDMSEIGAESEQRVLNILDTVEESEVQERHEALTPRIKFPPVLQPKPPDTAIDETDYWAHLTVELLKAPTMRRTGGKVTNYEYFCIYQSFVNTILAVKAGSQGQGRSRLMPSDVIRRQVKQKMLPGDDSDFPHPYISDEDIGRFKAAAMQHVRKIHGAYSRNEDRILRKCAKVHRLSRIFGASPGILILSEELSGWRLFDWFSNGDEWRSFIKRITSVEYAPWRGEVKRRLRI